MVLAGAYDKALRCGAPRQRGRLGEPCRAEVLAHECGYETLPEKLAWLLVPPPKPSQSGAVMVLGVPL